MRATGGWRAVAKARPRTIEEHGREKRGEASSLAVRLRERNYSYIIDELSHLVVEEYGILVHEDRGGLGLTRTLYVNRLCRDAHSPRRVKG